MNLCTYRRARTFWQKLPPKDRVGLTPAALFTRMAQAGETPVLIPSSIEGIC